MDYLIVTNNPLVQEQVDIKVEFCSNLDEVMNSTRNKVHAGYKLLTHPLSGSVKPVQSPYKSIILGKDRNNKQGHNLDYDSLQIIESALKKVEQFKKNHSPRKYPDSILFDYQTIDFSLLSSGLESL